MSQPDYTCEYPGLVQTDETCFRFTDKSIQSSERVLYSNYWREQINQFGVKVKYYVNTYNTLSADNFYGEQPTQTFTQPREITLAVTLNENAITLSKFGFESDDEVTAFIHISSFYDEFVTLSADFAPFGEDPSMLINGKIPQGVYEDLAKGPSPANWAPLLPSLSLWICGCWYTILYQNTPSQWHLIAKP